MYKYLYLHHVPFPSHPLNSSHRACLQLYLKCLAFYSLIFTVTCTFTCIFTVLSSFHVAHIHTCLGMTGHLRLDNLSRGSALEETSKELPSANDFWERKNPFLNDIFSHWEFHTMNFDSTHFLLFCLPPPNLRPPPHSLPPSSPLLCLITHWVPLVLPIYSWVWGRPL